MMDHDLKIWPEYFEAVRRNEKTCEIRKNDRNFAVGDFLYLREWCPKVCAYTGRTLMRPVRHIMNGGQFGIESGYVLISIGG